MDTALPPGPDLHFGPYRLDGRNGLLWHGSRIIPLSPKATAVLGQLVRRAGHLVSKAALFQAVWPATAVSDGVLAVCIRELRRALGDAAQQPRYIETVHRRSYRFIAPITATPTVVDASAMRWHQPVTSEAPSPGPQPSAPPPLSAARRSCPASRTPTPSRAGDSARCCS
jgi:DNA-binding winged helix-turn-helix (wHTH) protein